MSQHCLNESDLFLLHVLHNKFVWSSMFRSLDYSCSKTVTLRYFFLSFYYHYLWVFAFLFGHSPHLNITSLTKIIICIYILLFWASLILLSSRDRRVACRVRWEDFCINFIFLSSLSKEDKSLYKDLDKGSNYSVSV